MAARIGIRAVLAVAGACALTALAIGGTALAATSSSADKDAEPAEITWSTELDCTAVCHTRQVATLEDEETQIFASHAAFPCLSCHTDIEGMTEGHDGVTVEDTSGPKRLKKSDVTSDGCLTCHQVGDGLVSEGAWAAAQTAEDEQSEKGDEAAVEKGDDVEKADVAAAEAGASDTKASEEDADAPALPAIPAYSASATADVTYLTDANGTTVNPHDLPVNKSHDTITCATCHSMHDTDPLEETTVDACIKCHHDNVYECFTCHD